MQSASRKERKHAASGHANVMAEDAPCVGMVQWAALAGQKLCTQVERFHYFSARQLYHLAHQRFREPRHDLAWK
jgi:hypothetical protein